MKFGEYIRKLRLDSGKTVDEVAKAMGISRTLVSIVERCERKPYTTARIEKFANFLELPPDERAKVYDIAAVEKHEIPGDIEDIMMKTKTGEYARQALRMTKAGEASEEDWKEFVDRIGNKDLRNVSAS